ncbi:MULTISPECIES: ROK family transcriptional regulator [unclassified Streptomyces]|uniref:ROK family transcriptional regulator n=1 Tax=unclassified Streptomyces TaxID=2593676 RepID=UPI00278BBC97|nr:MULTISPECIES: ROK family transcriptional regulator [unclassified Streptomyces]
MKRTSRDIRTANRYEVLRRCLGRSAVSRQELAAETGLSSATVATLVGELADLGILSPVGFQDSAGGRPRGLVSVDAGHGSLVGVDVAETYVHAELFDLNLRVVGRADRELRPGAHEPGHVAAVIADAVRAVLDANPGGPVLGAGVCMPGLVDREGGISVYAPNWGWRDAVPLRELLAEHLDVPLYLDNPLRAATVAELWFGAARGRDDAVVVNLGTGVGAGLALGGALHRGVTNSAGEWGHTTLVLDGRPCHCGDRGCVEAYVGAPGIMRNLRELHPGSALLHAGDQTATIGAVGRAAGEGVVEALDVVRETARHLGPAVADLVNLLNPEVVVLTSWVAAALGGPLLGEVREAVARHALAGPFAATEVVLSPIPTDPVSLGAATFALEGVLRGDGVDAAGLRPGPRASIAGGA